MEEGAPTDFERSFADSKNSSSSDSFSRPSSLKFSSSTDIAQAKVSNRSSGNFGALSAAEKARLRHHSEVPFIPSDRMILDPQAALKKKLKARSSHEILSVDSLHISSKDTMVGPSLVPNINVARGLSGLNYDSSSSIDTIGEVLTPNEKARRVQEGEIPFSPSDHLTPHTAMKLQYQKASSIDSASYSNDCLRIDSDEK